MSGIRKLVCVATRQGYYFEGDIRVTPLRFSESGVLFQRSIIFGNRIKDRSNIWKNGRVPYDCHPSLKPLVEQAIVIWHDATPIRFTPYDNETAHVLFMPGDMNESEVGCMKRQQSVMLRNDATLAVVLHEIGHVVGLWHEHSRTDRGEHVLVNVENIQGHDDSQFNQTSKDAMDFGPYDIESIMHYDSFAFSGNGSPTIVRKDGGLIPQNERLSPGDIATIRSMYT